MRKLLCLGLVLVLLTSAWTALADTVTPVYSAKLQAVIAATRALEERYGISPEMHTYLARSVEQLDGESWRVTWTGDDVFITVLGRYTAEVRQGVAEVRWSHDGEENDGSYSSLVWGAQQLAMLIEQVARAHDYQSQWLRARDIMEAAGDQPLTFSLQPIASDAPEQGGDTVPQDEIDSSTCAMELAALEVDAADAIARATLTDLYSLTGAQAERLYLEDDETFYFMDSDTPILSLRYWLWQGEEDALPRDGSYRVLLDAATGVVEDAQYDSNMAGNG